MSEKKQCKVCKNKHFEWLISVLKLYSHDCINDGCLAGYYYLCEECHDKYKKCLYGYSFIRPERSKREDLCCVKKHLQYKMRCSEL